MHGGHVERPEHGLRHALTVGLESPRGLREQDTTLLGRNPELVVGSTVPDFLHVVQFVMILRRQETLRLSST